MQNGQKEMVMKQDKQFANTKKKRKFTYGIFRHTHTQVKEEHTAGKLKHKRRETLKVWVSSICLEMYQLNLT